MSELTGEEFKFEILFEIVRKIRQCDPVMVNVVPTPPKGLYTSPTGIKVSQVGSASHNRGLKPASFLISTTLCSVRALWGDPRQAPYLLEDDGLSFKIWTGQDKIDVLLIGAVILGQSYPIGEIKLEDPRLFDLVGEFYVRMRQWNPSQDADWDDLFQKRLEHVKDVMDGREVRYKRPGDPWPW